MVMDFDESSSGLTTTYEQVLHKKLEGKLLVTADTFTFTGDSSVLSWNEVAKHQVSPVNYPKALLKILLSNGKSNTYQLPSRSELERIRQDINDRLQATRSAPSLSGKKRSHSATTPKLASTSFGELDPTALAVTRSSLLAANPSLRAQHHYLVHETATLTEEDFWKTHNDLLEEEYARISGMTRAGSSSLLQSHLQLLTGRVTLGVEEMRQIFILYPAVHKAYEEKVPLELSDEQFWRKYLESEYFHRDRGRLGAASRQGASKDGVNQNRSGLKLSVEDQEARAAAIGTDDLFSRYDQKLREATRQDDSSRYRRWGTKLAIGQFDLASTFETERGQLLEGPKDNHPANSDDTKGSKVIQKYNRHWAMVLHPEDAVAGSDLMQVARQSVQDVLPGDDDAKAQGGVDEEMFRLVGFAASNSDQANHALGIGLADSDEYERLTLKNIEAYYSARPAGTGVTRPDDEATRMRNGLFANAMVIKMKALSAATREAHSQTSTTSSGASLLKDAFPPPQLGKELLAALTNKMAADSKTDEDALAIVNALPEDFKKRLHSYFRRSSELLRHFFGLRKLAESAQGTPNYTSYTQKQRKIVTGMETVYREMDGLRKELEATGETGELMRKMYLQIMDQLNWVFKLHREGSGGGGGGGFVTIEEF